MSKRSISRIRSEQNANNDNLLDSESDLDLYEVFSKQNKETDEKTHRRHQKRTNTGEKSVQSRSEENLTRERNVKNSKMKPSHMSHGIETLNKGHSLHGSTGNFTEVATAIEEKEIEGIDNHEHKIPAKRLETYGCVKKMDNTKINSLNQRDPTTVHYVPAKRIKNDHDQSKHIIKEVTKSRKRCKKINGLYSSYVKMTDFMKVKNVPTNANTKQVNYNTRSTTELINVENGCEESKYVELDLSNTFDDDKLSEKSLTKTQNIQATIKNPLRTFRLHRNDDYQSRDKTEMEDMITSQKCDQNLKETTHEIKNRLTTHNVEDGKVNETSCPSLQFIIDQLIEETSSESMQGDGKQFITSLENLEPIKVTTPLQIGEYSKCPTSSQIETNIESCDDDECSNLSLEMSEDSFDVKMAAEALSLLRNNGRTDTFVEMEEYVKNGQGASTQSSSASSPDVCASSKSYMARNYAREDNKELNITHKQYVVENGGPPTSVEVSHIHKHDSPKHENLIIQKSVISKSIPFNDQNSSSCTFPEKKKTRHRLQFDSTLEITDAVTGAKISLESFYFNSNENWQNVPKSEQNFLPESFLQLSDTVTCVKVPMEMKNNHPEEEKAKITQRYAALPDVNAVDMDDNVVCVQIPLYLLQQSTDNSSKTPLPTVPIPNDTSNSIHQRMNEEVTDLKTPPSMLQIQTKPELLNGVKPVKISEIEESSIPMITPPTRKLPLEPRLIRNKKYIAQIQQAEELKLPLAPPKFCIDHDNNEDANIQQVDVIVGNTITSTQKVSAAKTYSNTYDQMSEFGKVEEIEKIEVSDRLFIDTVLYNDEFSRFPNEDTRFSTNTNKDHHSLDINKIFKNERRSLENMDLEENRKSSNTSNTRSEKTMSQMDRRNSLSMNLKNESYTSSVKRSPQDRMVKSRKEKGCSEEQQSLLTNEYTSKKGRRTSHYQQMEEIRKALYSQEISATLKSASTLPNITRQLGNEDIDDDRRPSQEQNAETNFNKKPCISEKQHFEQNGNSDQIQIGIQTVTTPLESFSLLITDEMIKRILKYTNAKLEKLSSKSKHRSCFKKPTNETELRAFLGLLLISGALRQNQTTVPEIWSECYGAGIFRATLNEPRFQSLSHGICFGDSASRDECIISDEFTRIGDLWEEYLTNCKKYSIPSQSKRIEKIDNSMADPDGDDEPGQLYSTARKTVNMPLRILFSMLDGAGVRGLAIFRHLNPTVKMCQREFLKQVGMTLVKPQMRLRLLKPTLRKPIKELIESILDVKSENEQSGRSPTDNVLKKQKRCQLCPWKEDRKTKYQCESCQRAMCKDHRSDYCVDCIC